MRFCVLWQTDAVSEKTNQAKKDTANIMAATIIISAQSGKEDFIMAFFNSAVTVLQTLVVALGAGLGIWGAINLLEGYGNDNPGAKSQGIKQLMSGGGIIIVAQTVIPQLSTLFS